jgi:hypothetical protein
MSCPLTSNPYGPRNYEIDSLADGTRQAVTPSPGLPPQCPQGDEEIECVYADADGAYWIRWDASCYHCATTSYFQNIQSGDLRGDPTNATTFADLNSPALAHTTCPGVRVIPDVGGYGTGWDSLTSEGQFALLTGTNSRVFLERCGTRMRRLLADQSRVSYALASNAGAIVWQAVDSQLTGLLLPSLQAFTIPLPSAIVKPSGSPQDTGVVGLELSSDALYVTEGWGGTVWQTASPTALPLNTRRPALTRSGNIVTCRRGSWRNAVAFSYAWRVNGTVLKAAKRSLALGKARERRSVSCSVTASNTAGTTAAASAQLHLR